jgi:hypothetical protein
MQNSKQMQASPLTIFQMMLPLASALTACEPGSKQHWKLNVVFGRIKVKRIVRE